MALRHRMPDYPEDLLGPDTMLPIPRFPEPSVLRFRAGENVAALAASVVAARSVAIDAAPGAGKSVDFPVSLVRGGVGLVVHVLPSENLAYSLYDYVASKHSGQDVVFVGDYSRAVPFPKTGAVITFANVMVCYMAQWRATGEVYKMCLYLDEVHQSDSAMCVLRELRTAAPGVDQYIQATATMGSGDVNSPYRALVTKAKLSVYKYGIADPGKWDLTATGVPWSMKALKGDFLIFVDSDEMAAVITRKFQGEGITCHRFVANTPREVFLRQKKEIEAERRRGGPVCAMLVDSTYRDGVTFTSIARIIDTGLIKRLKPGPGGMPMITYRDMYMAESVQARSRGARIDGQDCDYWMPEIEPKFINLLLEGYEADVACIFFRMLGFRPPQYLQGTPTFEGTVPSRLMAIMGGIEPIRRYYGKHMIAWPGGPAVSEKVEELEPLSAPVSPVSSDAGEIAVGGAVVAGGGARPASVETVVSPVESEPGGLGIVGSIAPLPPPPLVTSHPHDRMSKAYSAVLEKVQPMPSDGGGGGHKCGQYAYVAGVELVTGAEKAYPGGVEELLGIIREIDPDEYAGWLDAVTRPIALRLLLDGYNSALALERAAACVMENAPSYASEGHVDSEALSEWLKSVRKAWLLSSVRKKTAYKFLCACARRDLRASANMTELETSMVRTLMDMFQPAMGHGRDESLEYGKTLADSVSKWVDMSGVYRIEWNPGGLREKLAFRVMGRKPPTAAVLFEAPSDDGGKLGW